MFFRKAIPENSIDKIVVYKSRRIMQVFTANLLIRTYRVSLGRQPLGHKEHEGDCRTPEGIYCINDKNPDSRFYKNLGISYPNEKDIEHARSLCLPPGGDIKIHGLRNGRGYRGKLHLFKNWTAGCIAVTNLEMEVLYHAVPIGTPIEIYP